MFTPTYSNVLMSITLYSVTTHAFEIVSVTEYLFCYARDTVHIHVCILWHCRTKAHLGSGQFGTVNKGVWHSPRSQQDVAIKLLQDGAPEQDRVKFLQEAAIMGQFSHPNIISLLGVVTLGEPVSDIPNTYVHTTLCDIVSVLMMMCYVCEGNDYYGVDGEWRPEEESTQHETNVRS